MFFIDDNLWNGEIGDSIRKKFAAPVDGLPQEEPLFTLNQYPTKVFEGLKAGILWAGISIAVFLEMFLPVLAALVLMIKEPKPLK